ncbi:MULTISPECIES: DUF1345 domain-containing protein [unclassified Mycobacterium]|uniref:DUF1345 domain-containing protein n=1 Tax=unclassified Mycobacterium TaxID=2642494 RepID=UPI0029C72884|nr:MULTISPECIES: DUF1345 domain-containing protein [unclassified Mycobacterium]
MTISGVLGRQGPMAVRVGVAVLIGAVAATAVATVAARYAPVMAWIATAATFVIWTWTAVGRMTATDTRDHATREDPTQPVTDIILLLASVASLAGVGYLLIAQSASGADTELAAAVGVGSVAVAWLIVHTVYTLRYARLYYGDTEGGIDFNQDEPPCYLDFAYLAFTLGMTYQVSDTNLQTREIRGTALRHALLSYVLGAVILATIINMIAGLGTSR